MQTTSDICEVARLLIQAGNRPRFSPSNLPAYQEAIRKVLNCPGEEFVDELGFVKDKDALRCYLERPIDFEWLSQHVALVEPLKAEPGTNRIFDPDNWRVIEGGIDE